MNEIKINDIKPLIDIPDFSIYLYILLWILGILFLLLFVFLIYKIFKNNNNNLRKEYFNKLKTLNLNDSKKSAYTITKYVRFLARNEREINISSALIEELENYKYKKDVPPLDHGIKIQLDRFLDIVDV